MKYIIINNHKGLGPCLFPITKTHADIAKIFMKPGEKIFSAGFVSVGPDGVKCYGKSRSLKVTSQKKIRRSLIRPSMESLLLPLTIRDYHLLSRITHFYLRWVFLLKLLHCV